MSFEVQLQVLLIEAERRLGIVAHVEVQLIAHLTVYAQLYLLVEIKDVIVSRTLCERGVVNELVFEAEEQFCRTLQFHLHAAGTKDFVCGTDIELHIGDIEFAFVVVFYFAYFALPVFPHFLSFGVGAVFGFGHHVGGSNLHIAYACPHHIAACCGVILYGCLHILGVLQIQTTGHAI